MVAVEPLAEMRAQLAAAVHGAEVLDGTAEEIPLEDGSADAVTVASAFHWFDLDRALPELHRVLRPGGGLVGIGNGRDLADPLQAAVEEIVDPYLARRPRDPRAGATSSRPARCSVRSNAASSPMTEQLVDAVGLADRLESVSVHRAAARRTSKADVLGRLRELGEAQPRSPFPWCRLQHARRQCASGRHRLTAILKAASVKAPKILAVASAVDLDFRYGCTPAWWQLWKGLHEAGCDLIVTPYRGRPVESPWWRTAPNPCYREGETLRRACATWSRG